MSNTSIDRPSGWSSTPFRCAGWRVDPELNTATFEGEVRRLGPTLISLWCALVSRCGRLVTKEELIRVAWQGRCVSDEAVTVAVYELRKLLGDRARSPRFIETIPGKGYRWLTEVIWEGDGEPPGLAEEDATDRAGAPRGSTKHHGAIHQATLSPQDVEPVAVAEGSQPGPSSAHQGILGRDPMPPPLASEWWRIPWLSRLLLGILLMWGLAAVAQQHWGAPQYWRAPRPVERALPAAALDAHLRGLALLRRPTPENLERAMDEFHAVTERVPDYGPSWAAMAEVCALLHEYGLGGSAELLARTDATARHALTLQPDHPGANYAMGLVQMLRFQHWQEAARHFERAVALDPTFGRAWQGLGWLHLAQGDLEAAANVAQRAALLEPRSGHQVHLRMMVAFASGEWQEALEVFDEAEASGVEMTYDLLGLKVAVLQHSESGLALWPTYHRMLVALGYSDAYIEELARIHQLAGFEGVIAHRLETVPEMPQLWRAVQAMWLGRESDALEALEDGVRQQQPEMLVVGTHPAFGALHSQPRFQSLLGRLGLL